MINGCKVLGLITARGGSKALPGKNLREVAGKPLIAYTVAAAKACRHLDRLVVSTDDEKIRQAALALGCEAPFLRDASLATDTASSIDVVLDALDRCPGFDYVVLLQPTSPLRTPEDIEAALVLCQRHSAPACVSVCEVEQSPYWMFTVGSDYSMAPILPGAQRATRRQDLPRVFALNGALYVASVASLREAKSFITPRTLAYQMPLERSLDVDTEEDLRLLASRLG